MPCLTAASASASIESAMKAGPHPQMVPAALSCAERMAPFADDDALAHRDRRVGNRREVVRAGCEQPFVVVEAPSGRHRDETLAAQCVAQRREHLLDLVGLHGHDDRVGKVDHLGRLPEGPDAAPLRVAPQLVEVAGAGPHLLRRKGPLAEQPLGQCAAHVAEADEAESHSVKGFE